VEVGLLGALLALTVLGNAAVLLALRALRRRKRRRKQSRMLYFIMHLSVADMVTAVLSVLPQLAWKVSFIEVLDGNPCGGRFAGDLFAYPPTPPGFALRESMRKSDFRGIGERNFSEVTEYVKV